MLVESILLILYIFISLTPFQRIETSILRRSVRNSLLQFDDLYSLLSISSSLRFLISYFLTSYIFFFDDLLIPGSGSQATRHLPDPGCQFACCQIIRTSILRRSVSNPLLKFDDLYSLLSISSSLRFLISYCLTSYIFFFDDLLLPGSGSQATRHLPDPGCQFACCQIIRTSILRR